MDRLLKYIDTTILNDLYVCKLKICESFYIRTNYLNRISIHSTIDINFYEELVGSNLLSEFNEDLIKAFKKFSIKVLSFPGLLDDNIINFKLKHDCTEICVCNFYPKYVSNMDPVYDIGEYENDINENYGKQFLDTIKNKNLNLIDRIKNNQYRCESLKSNGFMVSFIYEEYYIKSMEETSQVINISHQAYINYQLNHIVNLPNFMKLNDFVVTDKIIILSTDQFRWNRPIFYYIVDKIEGETFYNEILEMTYDDIINIITQIIYSIYYAYKKIKFTHYDLHLNNVIIKKLDKDIDINYDIDTLSVNKLAIMIDYEYSHVISDNKHIGYNYYNANIFNKESWISDIIKFLISIFDRCIKNDHLSHLKRMSNSVLSLLKFFMGENIKPGYFMDISKIKTFCNLNTVDFTIDKYDFDKFILHFKSEFSK